MNNVRRYGFSVDANEVDFTRRASLVSMTDYALRTAGLDADANGFGVLDYESSGITWVLLRFAIEIDRFPRQGEAIEVDTWVNDIGRLTTTRNFRLLDGEGKTLATAVSLWAMIDMQTRRTVDLRAHADYGKLLSADPSPLAPPEKLGDMEPLDQTPYRVKYSDVDFNRHANSMKYLQWLLDLMPEERHQNRGRTRLDINFMHEAHLGDELALCQGPGDAFEIRREGTPLCRIRLTELA